RSDEWIDSFRSESMRYFACQALSLAITVLSVASAVGQQPTESKAREAFESACDAFNRGWTDTAIALFSDYLLDFQKSLWIAERNYRRAACYLLKGDFEKAARVHESMIRNHFDSLWTQLAMQVHFDEKELAKLADERRLRGLEGAEADLAAAAKMYEYCVKRCTEKAKKAAESGEKDTTSELQKQALYKLGDCQIRSHRLATGRSSLEQA